MDFSLSSELLEMIKSIRDFVNQTVDPLSEQIERR